MFKQSITVFKPQLLSKPAISKLNNYNLKLVLKDQPSYNDYKMIYNKFLNIHPDNLSILLAAYPELKNLSHGSAQKVYLKDLRCISDGDFNSMEFKGPLVLDSNNALLANNEHTLDRLLHNFESKKHSVYLHNLVHPHQAEFADLY